MVAAAKTFVKKWMKDNVGSLAAIVSWNILTSLVPIIVGLVAISGFLLAGDASLTNSVVSHLSASLHGVLTPKDIRDIVNASIRHKGLLGVIGLGGALWGAANVGGAISTSFQAVFETAGRNFIKEKLLDVAMIVVMTALLLLIVVGTTAGAVITKLTSGLPFETWIAFVIGTAISLIAAFILFAAIYLAFPNVKPRLRFDNVWKGAVAAAILFVILSYVWPIYAHFAHFSRFGAVLLPILVLTAWIYFFSTIMLVGAEVVAISAIDQANREDKRAGPEPTETVPQHRVLREGPDETGSSSNGHDPSADRSHADDGTEEQPQSIGARQEA